MIAFKTEIKPTKEQKQQMNKTFGIVRYVYNLYISTQQEYYDMYDKFLTGYSFSKLLNNIYSKNKLWIKEANSKAIKQSIMNAEKAFKNFFKGSGYPKFKKKGKGDSFYLVKNSKTDFKVERHRIKIPSFGWVKLKEFGYLPLDNEKIKSCTITCKAGRYYISVVFDIVNNNNNIPLNNGIGIDLGILNLATTSDNRFYKNINKEKRIKKITKQLKRKQRKLSRQEKGSKNREKTKEKIQKIHLKLTNIREAYAYSVVNEVVKTKPSHITIEKLQIKNMMKNRHLSKAIGEVRWYRFKQILLQQSKKQNIEVREVDSFYPSSKICSDCGHINKSLQLSDRVYKCPHCGLEIDRDLNAAINLANAKTYKILA